jgi:hypothetical protein
VRHAGDEETRPIVEPLMDTVEFTRTVGHEHGSESRAELAAGRGRRGLPQ